MNFNQEGSLKEKHILSDGRKNNVKTIIDVNNDV